MILFSLKAKKRKEESKRMNPQPLTHTLILPIGSSLLARCTNKYSTEPKNVCISEIKVTFLKNCALELSETWQCCRWSPVTERQGIWITLILFELNCTSRVGGAKTIATYSLISLSCKPLGNRVCARMDLNLERKIPEDSAEFLVGLFLVSYIWRWQLFLFGTSSRNFL